LHDAKIAMERQIREELEAELTAQQEEDDSRSISDLENALRRQLSQAKSEQEDLLMKVRDSQQQFQAVREGFKSALVQCRFVVFLQNHILTQLFSFHFRIVEKLDKEKNRYRDLEKEKDRQQVVIEKMLEEHQYLLAQLEEMQENEQSRQEWEEERSDVLHQHQLQLGELGQREEECVAQINQLQNELDDLMNERVARDNEYEQLETTNRSLTKKCKEKDDELRRALDDLEHLNAENAEYLRRIQAYHHASTDNDESKVKLR
jgi:chromosome segregation ATPase